MNPNLEEMKKFKRFFQPNKIVPYQLFTKDESRRNDCRIVQGAWNKALYSELVKANTKQMMEIGMAINHCTGLGRSAKNVTEIVALFVDCDEAQVSEQSLLASAIAPHMIVETVASRWSASRIRRFSVTANG
jgi:putative DNA primase/helicase